VQNSNYAQVFVIDLMIIMILVVCLWDAAMKAG